MSSSNRVRISAIAESTYGVTPGAGNFDRARYVSEALSGTPETAESQLIRDDRQSSGQVVVGLTVGGELSMELAKDDLIEGFMESAMYNTWQTPAAVNADLDLDVGALTLTRAAGSFITDGVKKGDILTLTGFTNTVNNNQLMVAAVNSATELAVIVPKTFVTESSTGNTFKIADYMEIGTTEKSYSMEKAFLDLTDKAINYRGQIANTMNIRAAYGEIATISFGFLGNDYEPVDAAVDFMTDGRTINAAATTNPMNGTVDIPFIANDAGGSFIKSPFCIQSVESILNNNNTARNCIGEVAPNGYSEGTASVTVNMTAYLEDDDWNLMAKKLSQAPFSIGYLIKNAGGFYGVYLDSVQVSFDDPNSAGRDQDVFMNASGLSKIGSNGETAMRIFRG